MSDVNYCRECGAELAEDASFCAHCGHEVGTPPDAESVEVPTQKGDGDAASTGGRFDRLPGISAQNTTRRNVLVGGGYLFGSFTLLSVIAAAGEGTDGGGDGDGEDKTHNVGESFVVGGGGKQVRYTVNDARTQRAVGGEYVGAEADGEFVILRLEMTSLADETIRISSNIFTLTADGNEYETDSDAILAMEDNVIFEQLDPDVTKRGTLVFDVPTSAGDRALVIDPAGTLSGADSHRVLL
jgi:hypothetical protein